MMNVSEKDLREELAFQVRTYTMPLVCANMLLSRFHMKPLSDDDLTDPFLSKSNVAFDSPFGERA